MDVGNCVFRQRVGYCRSYPWSDVQRGKRWRIPRRTCILYPERITVQDFCLDLCDRDDHQYRIFIARCAEQQYQRSGRVRFPCVAEYHRIGYCRAIGYYYYWWSKADQHRCRICCTVYGGRLYSHGSSYYCPQLHRDPWRYRPDSKICLEHGSYFWRNCRHGNFVGC
ncbi:hypothetical protein D3C81_1345610 [compost metagenome]